MTTVARPGKRPSLGHAFAGADQRQQSREAARLRAGLIAGDPNCQVEVAWHCYQQLRSLYHRDRAADGRLIAEQILDGSTAARSPKSPASAGP
ncbi:MAG: hypothetical protein WBL06_08680 [Pseudolysinimonas sp.]|uniref:hypothetical protein n=1 Tax=Pseudolysinimonas sp. TaxID=2680009 RepID=UPI003C723ED5